MSGTSDAEVVGDMPRTWSGGKDANGWDFFEAQFLVKTMSKKDGPDEALHAAGLPKTGTGWVFGNDSRPDCYCHPEKKCSEYRAKQQDPGFYWLVDTTFSNKITFIGSPPKISINGQKYTKEVVRDRFGKLLTSTSHELFRGPQAEFDFNRIQVRVEYSRATIDLPLWTKLVDTVNISTMWGVPARCVKMEPYVIDEKRDDDGNRYFTITFEFTIYMVQDKTGAIVSGFDRDILNEGTKARGQWTYPTDNPEDATWSTAGFGPVGNPHSFDRYYDKRGNIARVILQANGTPWGTTLSGTADEVDPTDPPSVHVEYYPGSDLVGLLGLPDPLFS